MAIKEQLTGLSNHEAKQRLLKYGPNVIAGQKQLTVLKGFLGQFLNPLILILTIAAVISFFLGDHTSATIIISIVIISGILEFLNTYKSEKAAEELKNRVRITATVIREGREFDVPVAQLVVGDLVRLRAGDIIPADGKVLFGEHIYTNESTLTGESFPQAKDVNDPVYMGSSSVSGTAVMEIVATGKQTKFSHIAEDLSGKEELTEFDREIRDFSNLIIKITFVLVLFIFTVNTIFKHEILETLLFSLALAVGLTPELLPMIITLNLTKGSLAMAKRNVIVKKLSAIQDFGSMDILCTDKTGTLTENKIALVKHVDGEGHDSDKVLLLSYLSSYYSTAFDNPLDQAVKEYENVSITNYRKVDEIPFDFERKRDSMVVKHSSEYLLISKGAPEEILKICDFDENSKTKLTTEKQKTIKSVYEDLSKEGFRVLAVATREVALQPDYTPDSEKHMSFMGFIAFLDPAKASAEQTLKKMHDYGIEVKVITGDNHLVSEKIARDINLVVKGLLVGEEIENLNDLELAAKIEETTIFARVNPEQKMRIIKLLKRNGHVVGYMGDGINDAPSLWAADVGISVNNATDVAKDSADFILMHKSLEDLIEGVIEGRKTYTNTLKYLKMSLSSNFGNMFSMAGASIFLPFLPMLAPQILFNNLLYDGSQFAIPLDNVDRDDITRPHKLSMVSVKKFMWVFGSISSLFDLITFFALFSLFHFSQSLFQTGWFIESIATQTFVVYIIRTKKVPFIQSWPSKYLLTSTIVAAIIGWLVAFSALGTFFKFTSLPFLATLVILAIVTTYLVVVEYAKRIFFRRVNL